MASADTPEPGKKGGTSFATALARAEQHSDLNAFISLERNDPTLSAPEGRLAGLVLAVKDSIHVAGLTNTAGTPALEAFVPKEDAPLIHRLKTEGALIVGKTNMHELAFGITTNNPHFGVAKNPYDPTRSTGGSSGGSAIAVAARIVPAAIGGDTAASIRVPAALTGIIGFRPSLDRYPTEAITPLSTTRDVPGPMALTMDHITLLDSVMADRPDVTEPADPGSIRLGVARDALYTDLHPDIAAAMDETLASLQAAGITLVDADLDEDVNLAAQTGFSIIAYEAKADLEAYLAEYETGISFAELAEQVASPDIKAFYTRLAHEAEGLIPEAIYQDAMNVQRPSLIKLYTDYFEAHKVDALIFPTSILPAASIDENMETIAHNGRDIPMVNAFIRNTDAGSVAGLPGISLPMGLTKTGLPIGVELDALPGHDDRLLAVARTIAPLLKETPPPDIIGR